MQLQTSTRLLLCLLAFSTIPLQSQPRFLGSNWLPLGPAPVSGGQTFGARMDVGGRASAIAVNPFNPNDVWLGTANGGVWHSTTGGTHWTPMSYNEESLAIGSLALAGCSAGGCSTVYAGTGENAIRRDTYYGAGLLDGALSSGEFKQFEWTQRGRDLFRFASINNLVLDRSVPRRSRAVKPSVHGWTLGAGPRRSR